MDAELDGLVWGVLSRANGLLLVPVNTKLYVLDADSGKTLNQLETGGTIAGGAAAIARGKIVVKSGIVYQNATNVSNDEVVCYGLPSDKPQGAGMSNAPPASGSSTPGWSAVYREVIVANGCASGQCHSSPNAGGLSLLSQTTAYTSLVGVAAMGRSQSGASCADSGLLRVSPRDPDRSLLVQKLEHTQACGAPMPPAGTLPAAQLQRGRAWIAGGAAND